MCIRDSLRGVSAFRVSAAAHKWGKLAKGIRKLSGLRTAREGKIHNGKTRRVGDKANGAAYIYGVKLGMARCVPPALYFFAQLSRFPVSYTHLHGTNKI